MSRSRTVAVLTGVAVALLLAGHMAGKTGPPIPENDREMKASFEALQKKLPTMVSDWFKKEAGEWLEVKQVKSEVKLARFTGPADAKITVSLSMKVPELIIDFPRQYLSFYLHYYEGRWTTTRVDCPKMAEVVGSLMLAIDQASEK